MARVRSRDTQPELEVRRQIFAAGFRFRLHAKDLPGRPDLVFPRYRVAVFVHGCFWHGHGCKRAKRPATNTEFWNTKLDRNIVRDQERLAELRAAGWEPIIIWQCSLRRGIETLLKRLDDQRSKEFTR
jgi:DNA mismatch endonuclease (patch repair protein)